MRYVAWILPVALAACSPTETRAKEAVKLQLVDAGSAEFRDLRTVQGLMGSVVCGQVNARNRLGGYTGFQPFHFYDATNSAVIGDDRGSGCGP